MFKLSQRYLYNHYDVKSGKYNGSIILAKTFVRYQRIAFWWNWRKEQPQTVSVWRAVGMTFRWLFGKVDLYTIC